MRVASRLGDLNGGRPDRYCGLDRLRQDRSGHAARRKHDVRSQLVKLNRILTEMSLLSV